MSLSRSAATEKSEDATHADHVPRAEANLFSPAVTFDSLCHSRCARLCAIYLSNLGKMSIVFQPTGFVAGIRIFGCFMAASAVESRRIMKFPTKDDPITVIWVTKLLRLYLFYEHFAADKCFYVLCFGYSI